MGAFFLAVLQPLQANRSIAQWFLATGEERLAALDRATGLSWVGLDERRSYLARQSAGTIWIAGIRGAIPSSTAQAELTMLENRLSDSLQRNPQSLSLALNLGLVQHTKSKFFDAQKYGDAIQTLEEAIAHHPVNPQPYWALASMYLEQDREEEALAMTQAALDLDSRVTESHIQRLIAAKFSQDGGLFMRYANEALALSPGLESEVRLIYEADLVQKRDQLLFELY